MKKKKNKEFSKSLTGYDKGIGSLKVARTKYHKLSAEADTACFHLKQAISLRQPDQEKLETKARKANRLAVEAEGRYRMLVDKVIGQQRDFLQGLVRIYDDFETLQREHYNFIKQTLKKFASTDEDQLQTDRSRAQLLHKMADGIMGDQDITAWVAEKSNGQIPDPTIVFQGYPRQHLLADTGDPAIGTGGAGQTIISVNVDDPAVTQCRAISDYTAREDGELSFKKGDVLDILDQDDSGWWAAEKNGAQGLVPSNYLESIH